MQSDKEFVLFRRFGHLHSRIFLHKQDAIICLEQELNELDNNETNAFFLNSRRADQNTARHDVLARLEPKLTEYGKICGSCCTLSISDVLWTNFWTHISAK